jgi:alkanesulfonate monooxygenase SsuD/methylene tetrahydromethanopterin reductase-like flavin-dependent oxidoreductase (luciferase family)
MEITLLSLGDLITDPVTGERMTSVERHRTVVDYAVGAEAAGFTGFHVGEHHAMEYVYSAPPVILSAISQRTTTLRLGTGVTLLANLDPVRVAEDYATLDVLSNGRVDIVGGRGNIFASVYELFGQPLEESQARFEENLRLLLQIWTGATISWDGRFRPPIKEQQIGPAPVQRPHPPVWVGGGLSKASAELAATLGLPLMLPVTTFQPAAVFEPAATYYRERWTELNPTTPPQVGAVFHSCVARTTQQLRERFQPRYHAYWDWSKKLIGGTGPLPPFFQQFDFDALVGPEGSAVAGTPEQVVDKLGHITELLGLNTAMLFCDLGGTPFGEMRDMVDLTGAEVLPKLR